jgi:hypothetical protein
MMEEIWKDIVNHEGYYQVSNLGRVKSLERKIYIFNKTNFKLKEKILLSHTISKGYSRISLLKDKINKKYLVHRLVAQAFIENTNSNLNQVNHIDGNKKNNEVNNLEWCNNSQNVKHSYSIGLQKPKYRSDNQSSKKVAKYDEVGNLIKIYDCMTDAAIENNSHISNISSCCYGRRSKVKGYIYRIVN